MKTTLIILSSIFGITFVIGLCIVLWVFGIYNTEIALRTRYDASVKEVETSLDTMSKTLQNKYKINKEFAETFIKAIQELTKGREGGGLFKMVSEASGSVPQTFTPEIAADMMNTISGEVSRFKRSQDTMVDVWREHTRYCQSFPQRFFVGSMLIEEPGDQCDCDERSDGIKSAGKQFAGAVIHCRLALSEIIAVCLLFLMTTIEKQHMAVGQRGE
jgi:hypothetical protein